MQYSNFHIYLKNFETKGKKKKRSQLLFIYVVIKKEYYSLKEI